MMDKLQEGFRAYFNNTSGIELPVPLPERGEVRAAGWTIKFVRCADVDGTACLDFYAQNRMTNSRHVRVLASGKIEDLESYQDAIVFNTETGDDWGKALQARDEHNKRVTEALEAKGLL
jgi:hypothetical protein